MAAIDEIKMSMASKPMAMLTWSVTINNADSDQMRMCTALSSFHSTRRLPDTDSCPGWYVKYLYPKAVDMLTSATDTVQGDLWEMKLVSNTSILRIRRQMTMLITFLFQVDSITMSTIRASEPD